MSMSVRKIQMNETESKNDHLVITHQPFLLHDFFPPKHMASESISRAQDTRKHSRSSNSLICIHFFFSATALKYLSWEQSRGFYGLTIYWKEMQMKSNSFDLNAWFIWTSHFLGSGTMQRLFWCSCGSLIYKTWFSWKSCLTFLKGNDSVLFNTRSLTKKSTAELGRRKARELLWLLSRQSSFIFTVSPFPHG